MSDDYGSYESDVEEVQQDVNINSGKQSFEEEDDFVHLPDDIFDCSPKKVKVIHQQEVHKPVPIFDEISQEEYGDLLLDPDPAFKINREKKRKYIERQQKRQDTEKKYNFFRISLLNDRRAYIHEIGADKTNEKSKQEKESVHLLALNEQGKQMLPEYVDKDTQGIIFLPIQPPDTIDVLSVLGDPEPPGTPCFGCTHGLGFPTINGTLVEKLEGYMKEVIPNSSIIHACIKISYYYTTQIQAETNRDLDDGELPLPDWTPRQVYDCITSHRPNPSLWCLTTFKQLQTHAEAIRNGGLYNIEAKILEAGRTPTTRDIRISRLAEKSWFDTIGMQLKILQATPTKLNYHNDKTAIVSKTSSIIAPKTNIGTQMKITDLFSNKQ